MTLHRSGPPGVFKPTHSETSAFAESIPQSQFSPLSTHRGPVPKSDATLKAAPQESCKRPTARLPGVGEVWHSGKHCDGKSSIRFFTDDTITVMDEHGPTSSERDEFARRMRSVREGHNEALGELLDTCRTYLLLVANQGLPDNVRGKIGASDLVQDAFLQAQQIFDRFQGDCLEELRAWLGAILENKLAQVRRHYLGTAMRDVGREVPFAAGSSSPGIAGAVDPARSRPVRFSPRPRKRRGSTLP